MQLVRKRTKAQLFVAAMIKHRGLEFAQLKMQVEVDGDIGTIVGMTDGAHLKVRYANQLKMGTHDHPCHPKWRVKYFDAKGACIAHFDDDCNCVFRPGQPAQTEGAAHAA
ncbi:hypothetical protein [Pseudomonas putida]|uniref:hypothetical protein n=1 Tax=Pseudomonas putida TaxID=303 RepID=UPI0033112414|nr:hypothetical protein [Pseudomonas putida]